MIGLQTGPFEGLSIFVIAEKAKHVLLVQVLDDAGRGDQVVEVEDGSVSLEAAPVHAHGVEVGPLHEDGPPKVIRIEHLRGKPGLNDQQAIR